MPSPYDDTDEDVTRSLRQNEYKTRTLRVTGRRDGKSAPVIEIDGNPIENRMPEQSDWFSWGKARGSIPQRVTAFSLAEAINDLICPPVSRGNGASEEDVRNIYRMLSMIQTNTWTLDLEVRLPNDEWTDH